MSRFRKKKYLWLSISIFIFLIPITFIVLLVTLPIFMMGSEVSDFEKTRCAHYDNQILITRVVQAILPKNDKIEDFGHILKKATEERIYVDVYKKEFSNGIWMIPFNHTGDSGYESGFALLDCRKDIVEFSLE